MATLVIENVPAPLFERIQRIAEEQHCTPADAAIGMMEKGVRLLTPTHSEPPLPDEPFLTTEISAPFDLPRPKGTIVDPSRIFHVPPPLPDAHDLPEQE